MERLNQQSSIFANGCAVHGRLRLALFLLIVLALLSVISCADQPIKKSQAKGVYHIVKKGETAYSIARAYSVNLQDLAEVNNISDVSNIKEGSVIFIPDADQVIDDVMISARKASEAKPRDAGLIDPAEAEQSVPSKPADKPVAKTPGPDPEPTSGAGAEAAKIPVAPHTGREDKTRIEQKTPPFEAEVKLEKGRFDWPVKGTVKTRFGIQPNKTFHNWIKIACPAGAKVKAAASGTVIFSSNLPPFGETVIIRHQNDFATVYTHLKKRSVKADQNIKRGEIIAFAGEKDEMGDTYINFEIRLKGNKPRNPLFYLP